MAITKIPAAGFTGNNFRNIIINGDMSIAQRATSVASITGNGYNTVDRYSLEISSLGTWTQSQSTDVPTGQGFAKSLKMDNTTADASPGTSDYIFMSQKFEGQNLQYLKKGTSSAESLTLSFWVKSNKTGTYVVEIRDADNDRNICKSYTISSSNTWEKKELTFAGDTTGALGNDNGNSLNCTWWLAAGTDFTSGTLATSWEARNNTDRAVGQVNLADDTANDWYITGVQLEAGTTASDFEFLPYDVNLARCQRYCLKYGGTNIFDPLAIGIAGSSTELYTFLDFRTQMRATPSVTSSTLQTNDFSTQQAVTALVTIANQTNNSMGYVKATVASGLTQFRPHFLQSANSTSAYLIFSAEL
jgi:hypothetical protein